MLGSVLGGMGWEKCRRKTAPREHLQGRTEGSMGG